MAGKSRRSANTSVEVVDDGNREKILNLYIQFKNMECKDNFEDKLILPTFFQSQLEQAKVVDGILPVQEHSINHWFLVVVDIEKVDWGMYIIKYMEALDENLWRCTYYKNPEMGVERLRLLASLLKSPYNDFRDVLWYTDPNSRLFDEMVLFSDEEDVAKD
ncbi:hypothetical protein CRG98_019426 [Punica granatum]|uniref:Ubiquitin-like protease family profile domain-containing protein n=1 Tax=Punica granatum TaxID=22663 RepID=A0A2I0JV93_PUNGR|nr:hypothetical protein CRG98_019426 [Punica granatum]